MFDKFSSLISESLNAFEILFKYRKELESIDRDIFGTDQTFCQNFFDIIYNTSEKYDDLRNEILEKIYQLEPSRDFDLLDYAFFIVTQQQTNPTIIRNACINIYEFISFITTMAKQMMASGTNFSECLDNETEAFYNRLSNLEPIPIHSIPYLKEIQPTCIQPPDNMSPSVTQDNSPCNYPYAKPYGPYNHPYAEPYNSYNYSYAEPYSSYNYPYADYNYPYTGYNYPYTGYNYPYTGYNYPYTGYNYPYTGYNYPYTGYNYPYTGYNYPYTGYNYPYTGYNYPYTGYNYPYTGYNYPYTGYSYPYAGYSYPYAGYSYPYTGYNSPYVGYNYPYTGHNYSHSESYAPDHSSVEDSIETQPQSIFTDYNRKQTPLIELVMENNEQSLNTKKNTLNKVEVDDENIEQCSPQREVQPQLMLTGYNRQGLNKMAEEEFVQISNPNKHHLKVDEEEIERRSSKGIAAGAA